MDALRQCDYEARAATAQIKDELEAGLKQETLKEACMEAKGFYVVAHPLWELAP